jgi:hypothetical protein
MRLSISSGSLWSAIVCRRPAAARGVVKGDQRALARCDAVALADVEKMDTDVV